MGSKNRGLSELNYLIFNEFKNAFPVKKVMLIVVLMLFPLIYFFIRKDQYVFPDELSIFTFMFEGVFSMVFVLAATFIYALHFSSEIKNRFIFYERTRMSIRKLLSIKLTVLNSSTFIVFFLLGIGSFIFSFYIAPSLELIDARPIDKPITSRHTFTQLFQYGPVVYGLLYSGWIALHAALFASLAFFFTLIMSNAYIALSLPFLIYMIGAFLLPSIDISFIPFWFVDSIFPFGYVQQPIWTAFVPFIGLLFVCILLFVYVYIRAERLDNLL